MVAGLLIGINDDLCTAARRVTGIGVDFGMAEGLVSVISVDLCTAAGSGVEPCDNATGRATVMGVDPIEDC